MSLVTLGDQAKALAMLGSGSSKTDELLVKLARQLSWTSGQRKLIDKMWAERQSKQEAAMGKLNIQHSTLNIAGALALLLGATACAATYEKQFTDHEGRAVVITEEHDPDWWNNIGTPDWMNVRHEVITRDGKVITDRRCTHEPTHPQLLDCTGK